MGYTHYWRPKKPPTDAQWQDITDGFKKLQTLGLLTKALPIQREYDDPNSPEVGQDGIIFNGIGNAGHETFYVERNTEAAFNCCKTARKPYDMVVMAVLLLMDHFAPEVWRISSDGGRSEWQPAINWLNTTRLGAFTLPDGIE